MSEIRANNSVRPMRCAVHVDINDKYESRAKRLVHTPGYMSNTVLIYSCEFEGKGMCIHDSIVIVHSIESAAHN